MKLQRSTGVLLGVAIALVTTVTILETTKNPQPDRGETLYDFTENDIATVTINRADTTLSFTKTDDTWQMTAPKDTPADPSSIAFLLNIITSETIAEKITTDPAQLSDYGLASPAAVIEMTVADERHTLDIGAEDFSGTSLYAKTSSATVESSPETADSANSIEVYLLPKRLATGIERPVDEWILKDDSEPNDPQPETVKPTDNAEPASTDGNTDETQGSPPNEIDEKNGAN